MRPYSIEVGMGEDKAIWFAATRYQWADQLIDLGITHSGKFALTESQAWMIKQAIEEDYDACCPCLSPDTKLYQSLMNLINNVV